MTSTELKKGRRFPYIRGWVADHRSKLRIFLLAIGAMALLSVAYFFFPRTPDGSFAREMVVALLGSVVTVLTAGLAAVGVLAGEIKKRREFKTLEEANRKTWRRRSISAGLLTIPGIVIVASGNRGKEWTERADVRFEKLNSEGREQSAFIEPMQALLTKERERAALEGITLHNGGCIDLRRASVELRHDRTSGRRYPEFVLSPRAAT